MTTFFDQEDWHYSVDEGKENSITLTTRFVGESLEWNCFGNILETQSQFAFYSVLPVLVPPAKHLSVAKLITQINYSLIIGNFELNFEEGQVLFKTSVDAEGSHIDTALVKRMVYTNVLMMNQYSSDIMKEIYAD